MSWYERAKAVIWAEHSKMPPDISFEDRKKRIRDAYPFGLRAYHPYKQWCKAQREYLARHSPQPRYLGPIFDTPKSEPNLAPTTLFDAEDTP